MRKKRHILNKNWANLRAKISQVAKEKGLLESDFRPLSVHENWEQIEEQIYQTFCSRTHHSQRPAWLWNYFKLESHSHSCTYLPNRPETYLDKLVDTEETVWYLVNETINEQNKFWIYEGKIKSIQAIIDETWFNELYIVSQKYEWLLCINHHDTLIGTGKIMCDRLKKLELNSIR